MNWRKFLLGGLLLGMGCTTPLVRHNQFYQYSTITALLSGVYDGDLTYGELRHHGDFGLGTFQGLDGEMVAVDGKFYQVRSDGHVVPVEDSMQTPFAVVTYFQPDRSLAITNMMDFFALQKRIDDALPTKNTFYAIKVTGDFKTVIARSVPRQEKPYPPLVEASKKQAVFDLYEVHGTLVGFRTPEYASGLNVSGYHFHFLTADRLRGGHVLTCQIRSGTVEIAEDDRFLMLLPKRGGFQQSDLSQDRSAELNQAEKGAARK